MTYSQFYSKVKLIVLFLCTFVLLSDAAGYYGVFAQDTIPTVSIPTVSLSARPTPTPEVRPVELSLEETVDATRIALAQQSFLGSQSPTQISSIAVYMLKYQILGKDGLWKTIPARVYIPTGEQKDYPLFVFAAGTTGIADKCAPLLEDVRIENLGNYHNHMITQAASGFVSVIPDYEGYNDPQETEKYFISESESKVLLGLVENLYHLRESNPLFTAIDFQNIFLSGYSQGGHAALSSAKNWKNLPSDVKLKGVVAYAGAADVRALFVDSPWLASYLTESLASYYGSPLTATDILQHKWVEQLSTNNASLCVNDAYRFYPHAANAVYTPAFADAVVSNTWPSTLARWKQVIEENTPLSGLPDIAYLSLQGETDPIVTVKTQRSNTRTMCAQKKNLRYQELPGINHFQVRRAGFSTSTAWMKAVVAGQVTESNCP